MAAAGAAALALVAPYHAVAPSKVQGDGTDWHLGYYAALCVLFGRAIGLELGGGGGGGGEGGAGGKGKVKGGAAKQEGEEEGGAIVEGPVSARLFGVALVYALLLPVLGLQEKAGRRRHHHLLLHHHHLHHRLSHRLSPTTTSSSITTTVPHRLR
jgi:hypothetical protein